MVEHWESCECRKCDQKRIAELREENERLREALHRINSATNSELGMVRLIAREALESGGDDE